jgi:hypothetical protein
VRSVEILRRRRDTGGKAVEGVYKLSLEVDEEAIKHGSNLARGSIWAQHVTGGSKLGVASRRISGVWV